MTTSTHPSAIPVLRMAHPLVFASFLERVGTPIHRLMGRLGLPPYSDDPTAFVPLKQAWLFWDAAAQLEDPFLGWHVGRFYGDKQLSAGMLSRIERAPTLYQGLNMLVRLVSAEASHLRLGILERPDEIVFYTQYSTIKDWPGYATSQAYQLEVYLDLIRHYVGRHWVPREIGIEAPTIPTIAEEHFPGARVRPNQQIGYLTVERSCLHLPPRSGTGEQKVLPPLVLASRFDFVDTLSALLEPHLPRGYPSQQLAASLIDTSVRTLARRLSESGVSYQSLIDRLRFRVAKEHLLNPATPIIDVANAVGFHDPGNFARMFRRIAGLSPRQFRQVGQA